ncbi:glutathione S-transferase [Anianabacter salinae]|uniref:glutathione S-transferase n=1 Tax=Anianabacter salinae TaxID=2851023 RepID=UPI00225E0F22|nr:glutathione S-transferase [Anianabacter salinae]MBV0913955.1 glutathione S-transferase [Anianabacter salinae]
MDYTLLLGDRSYSSWSLRAWLMVERFGLPVATRFVDFASGASVAEQLAEFAPARTVPTLVTPEGAIVSESLALAEELATRFPDAGLWPSVPLRRAVARTLASEMHAGFGALREFCPMNLRAAYQDVPAPDAVLADVARIETIWTDALGRFGGPWLAGDYSIADAFFAPVAMRIAGYGLPVSDAARAYVDAHLADPALRRWRALGLVTGETLPWYKRDYPPVAWPGPAPIPAQAVDAGPSVNALCPYSHKPVTHFLQAGGRIWGFCNPVCRDKTAADPGAWPAFMAIYQS